MITVTFHGEPHAYTGFSCSGHAEYAEPGEDIVCAAVSALTLTTANALEALTEDGMQAEQAEDGGYLMVQMEDPLSERAAVLLDALALGLQMIEESYGNRYLTVITSDRD